MVTRRIEEENLKTYYKVCGVFKKTWKRILDSRYYGYEWWNGECGFLSGFT